MASYLLLIMLVITAVTAISRDRRQTFQADPEYAKKLKEALPADAAEQIVAVGRDDKLQPEEKAEKIHGILMSLPDSVLSKLPAPPKIQKLPQDFKDELKKVFFNKSLPWADKKVEIRKLFDKLTPEQKAMFPMLKKFYGAE